MWRYFERREIITLMTVVCDFCRALFSFNYAFKTHFICGLIYAKGDYHADTRRQERPDKNCVFQSLSRMNSNDFFFIHLWYSIPFFTFVVWGSWSRWIYLMRDNDDDVVSRWLVIRIRARLVRMSLMKLISLLLPLLLLWDNHCIIFIF